MKLAKTILTALCSMLVFSISTAQNNSGSVKGTLKDSANKQILSLATVTVFIAKDTSIVTYRLSDPNGNFRIPSLPLDIKCRILVSFSGYKTFRKEFMLTKEATQLDLGTILLVNDPQHLEEIVVLAERPPVSVRKDTIEFNASAFKTLPSALVEDLLKKLPGIDVDPEGNITVKGKRVNRLLVDGKEFFGGDPKIATKNLPADIVDKVQVMNDKEELDRNPDMPESQIGQVVNIKLKKSIKQGWFGKAYAGAGTNKRYETGTILNIFRDTTQISLLGYRNNINKAGFGISDIEKIGGFQRSGLSTIMINSDGGFELNGISFGGTGQGLQTSTGGGFNFNNQFGKKVTMNLQYFYGENKNKFSTISSTTRYFEDTIQTTTGEASSQNVSRNHRLGGSVIWKIDSLTTLTFRPGITLTSNNNFAGGITETAENFRGKINSSNTTNNGEGKAGNYSHNLFLNKSFKKRGRILTMYSDLNISNNDNSYFNDGVYSVFEAGMRDDSLVHQLRETTGDNRRLNSSFTFTEPLNKKLSLRVGHTIDYLVERNDINFFRRNGVTNKYESFNEDFSNGIERNGLKNISTTSLTYRNKKFSVTPGINFLNASFHNDYTKNPSITQRFNYVYPSLSLNWGNINLSYRANIQEPRASDLQQVIDISNRFFQQYGNPELKPTYSHNVSVNAYKFIPKSGHSYSMYVSGSFNNNAVFRATTVDRNGVRTTRPFNASGTRNLYSYMSYNYQYKLNKNFRVSLRPGLNLSTNEYIISVNGNRSSQHNSMIGPSLGVGLNYKDKIELNQRYNHSYRKTTYQNKQAYTDYDLLTHYVESEVVIRWPKHVVWENLVNYVYNPQVAQGIRKSSVRWNAGVNYLFLKEEKGQIRLSVYDLLNQNISVSRFVNENYVSDVQTTTLTRYFMLSFIYNLRTFSGGKVGGKDRSIFFF